MASGLASLGKNRALEKLQEKSKKRTGSGLAVLGRQSNTKKNQGGLLGGIEYVGANLGLGFAGVGEGLVDLTMATGDILKGDTDMAKYRFMKNVTAEAREKLQQEYNPNKAMQIAGDVSSGIGNSLVFMLPYVGPYLAAAGYTGMGISNAAEKTGDVGLKEIGYGAVSGGMEFALDKLTGGIGKAGKNVGSAVARKLGREAGESVAMATGKTAASKLAGAITGKAGRGLLSSVLIESGKGALGEAAEESLTEIIDPVLLKLFNIDENAEWDWKQIAYAGLVGGLSGGLMTAGPAAINYKSSVKAGRSIRESGQAESMVNYAKTTAINAANRKRERYKAAGEWKLTPKEDATVIGKTYTGARNLVNSVQNSRAESRVKAMAEKVSKNVKAYEEYMSNPKKTEKELEVSDAILGELRGNLFLLENATLLEVYEEAVLELDTEDKQDLVNDLNARAKEQKGKADYTVADLEANTDDILTSIAAKYMTDDQYGELDKYFQKRKNAAAETQNPETTPQAAAQDAQDAEVAEDARVPTQNEKPATANPDAIWEALKPEEGVEGFGVQNKEETDLLSFAIGKGVPKKSIPAMLDAYRANTTQMTPEEFAEGWNYGVNFLGRYNIQESSASPKSSFVNMDKASRSTAVSYGRAFAKEQVMREQKAADMKKVPAESLADARRKAEGRATVVKRGKGFIIQDLSKEQYGAYKGAEIMAPIIGADIVLEMSIDSKDGKQVNGFYDPKDNSIHINISAVRNGKHIALYTLGHEVTHYVREWSPEKFSNLADFVMNHLGGDTEALISDKLATLRTISVYQTMTDEALRDLAREEVVADGMELILTDGKVLEELAHTDRSLWQRVKAWIQNIIAKIKKAYGDLNQASKTAQTLRETLDTLDEVERLFTESVREAGERVRTAEPVTSMNEENVQVSGKKLSVGDIDNRTFTYKELVAKGDIVGVVIDKNQQVPLLADGNIDTQAVLKTVRSKCESVPMKGGGTTYYVNVPDIGRNVRITGDGITHGFKAKRNGKHTTSSKITARATLELPYILENSIEVNRLTTRGNQGILFSRVMIGTVGMEDTKGNVEYYAVRMVVEERTDNESVLVDLDILGDLYAANAKKVDRQGHQGITRVKTPSGTATIYAYNITHFLNEVKGVFKNTFSNDVYQTLGTQRKQDDFSKDLKYSIDPDTEPTKKPKATLEEENRELTEKLHKMQYAMVQRAIKSGEISAKMKRNAISKGADAVLDSIGVTDGSNRRELVRRMEEIYAHMAAKNGISYEQAFEEAEAVADWLISRQPLVRDAAAAEQAQEILKTLHGSKIRLTFTQKGEVAQQMGSTEGYRKAMFGKVTVSDQAGTPLDVQWAEWSDMYPEVFADDVTEADMPTRLLEIYENLMAQRDYVETVDEYIDAEALTSTIFEQVGRIGWEAETSWVNDTTILANALEGAVTSEQEWKIVQEYKNRAGELEQTNARISALRREAVAVNREIGSLLQKKKQSGNKEPWVLTTLDEAYKRKGELIDELDHLVNTIQEASKRLLSLRATKPLQKALAEANKRAEAMEKRAQRAEEQEKKAWEWSKETVREVRTEERGKGKEYKEYLDRKEGESQERGEITVRKRTVVRLLGSLSTKLYHPTKTNHVPQELLDLALKTLHAADPGAFAENRANIREMGDLSAKIEKLERKAARKATEQDTLDRMKSKYEKLEAETLPLKEQAKALLTAFVEYNKTVPDDQKYPEGFINIMTARVNEIESKPLVEMGLRSLEAVETFVSMLSHQIDTMNNTFATERTLKISDLGQKASTEAADSKPLKFLSPTGKEWAAMSGIRNFFWKNLKPLTVFEAIGSKTFADLFQNVLNGEDTWARDIVEAREKILKARENHGYKDWDLDERTEVQTGSGPVSLNLRERMALYALSFRENAESHLQGGGFVLDPMATEETKIKGLSVDALKKRLNDSKLYVMDKEMLGKLAAGLTKEQKEYVKEMQAYLTELGKKGNEVSRKLYGIDIFTEEFYFPMKVSSVYLEAQTGKTGDPNLKNMGMTKEIVPNAENPLVLQGFDEIMVDHINNMATYHAFVLPMEDLRRVLNYKPVNYKTDENGDVILDENGLPVADSEAAKQYDTLQAVIKSKYGQQANAYIIQLMRDLNGGARRDAAAGIIDRGITAFKRASTMASLSVLVQQPTSIFRAAAYIEPKYLFGNASIVDFKKHKELWERVKKYAPVAIIKEMGGYDTGVGARTGDYLNAAEYGKGERLKGFATDANYRAEVFGMGAAYADEMAWIQIFEACVSEQADKLKNSRDSEAVLEAAGKRFEEVVRHTQVYDSTLTRSENMRSKDTGAKMATAFMSEPTTVVSMIAEAIMKAERGDMKFLRNTAGAVAASIIVNSLASSLVYALRDDDEEKTYGEKYLSKLAMETAEGFNPFEYFPVFRDIFSLIKGYEVERTDMALVGDLLNQVQSLTSSKKTVAQKVLGVSGAVASFFGLPLTNVVRDANGFRHTFLKLIDTERTERMTGKGLSVALKQEFDTIFNAFDEKTRNSYQLYQAVLDGDNKHYARVVARYESSKDAELALRQALREYDPRITEAAKARLNGDLDVYESLVDQIESEGKFDRNIAIRAINNQMTWIQNNDTAATVPQAEDAEDTPEALYSTSDLNAALERGDAEDWEMLYYVLLTAKKEQGKTEAQARSSIKSSITSYWKKQYLAAWEANDTKEIKRIQSILLSTGLYGTRNDVATTGQEWVKAYAASKNKK